MGIIRRHTPELDGGAVAFDGGARERRLTIVASGAPATPFWVRLQPSGVVVQVTSLPWRYQGVAESAEYLSEDPSAEQTPLLAFLDWRTAPLGSSDAAATENGKATLFGQSLNTNVSVPPEGENWQVPRVLNCIGPSPNVNDGWVEPRITGLPVHAENTVRTFRWYFALREPDNLRDAGQHHIQDGGAVSVSSWYMGSESRRPPVGDLNTNVYPAGHWNPSFHVDNGIARWYLNTSNQVDFSPYPLTLPKNTPFRFVLQRARLTGDSYRMHAWIYDMGNTLLYDDADFWAANGFLFSGQTLADNPVQTSTRWDASDRFVPGSNGIGPPPGQGGPGRLVPLDPELYGWPININSQGGIAITDSLPEGTPLGPYGTGQGEQV